MWVANRVARYEDAESRLKNVLRTKTAAGDERGAAEVAARFVATLEVRTPFCMYSSNSLEIWMSKSFWRMLTSVLKEGLLHDLMPDLGFL